LRRAVGEPVEHNARVGRDLVEVLLVLVDADRERRLARRGGRPLRGNERQRGYPLASRPAEERQRLLEDEDEDEEDADDDEEPAERDDARGGAVGELDARDPPRRGGHLLANADAGCGHRGSRGRVAYSSLASSSLTRLAGSGR